jgi:AcrR family transcriptional regulator
MAQSGSPNTEAITPERDNSARRVQIERLSAELFSENGYHATTMRDIAARVGVQPASLYYHFDTKQSILLSIMHDAMLALHHGMDEALSSSDDPVEQMRAAVIQHVRYHTESPIEAIIADTELRALSGDQRREIQKSRDTYQGKFEQILRSGAGSGVFSVPDEKLAVYSILEMCSGVSAWYRPDGRLTGAKVAEVLAELVLQLTGSKRN